MNSHHGKNGLLVIGESPEMVYSETLKSMIPIGCKPGVQPGLVMDVESWSFEISDGEATAEKE